MTAVVERLRAAYVAVFIRIAPTALRWWSNPVFQQARRPKPLPLRGLRTVLPVLAGGLFLLSIGLWVVNFRLGGAALVGLSVGVVLALALVAPAAAAHRAATQLRAVRANPAALADLSSESVTWGLALAGLWRLRWLIVVALALTPALMVGLLRIDASTYAVLSRSARELGAATDAAGRAIDLLPGGRVPAVRLGLRALSGGLLVWALLPGLALLGVGAALYLGDPVLALLAALLGGVVLVVLATLIWSLLSGTPLIRGPFEVLRFLLEAAYLVGLGYAAHRVNGVLAARLEVL